jgi:hypothetical protein
MVTIQVSVGELIDKLSILQIKLNNIQNEDKLKLIKHEYNILHTISIPYFEDKNISELYFKLIKVNSKLWDVEDKLRVLETENRFGGEFIDLARQVYYLNDERFEIKNQINSLTNSEVKEVKEYVKYK